MEKADDFCRSRPGQQKKKRSRIAVRGSQFLADDWRLKQTMKEITRCNSESNFPESPLSSISGRLMCCVKSTRDEGLSTDCGAQSMIGKFLSYTRH
ncbi:hypothetical protein TNCV_2422011 [Trichonephila clavipes]|nr:hypothetical protein TNCV_2422011 [Trichonephila clavipes]